MRRTTTRLALAAGAGASAVLLTAGSALAAPTPEDWADQFTQLSGYSAVSCLISTIPGNESSVYISESQWSPLLRGDNEFVGVGLELVDGTSEQSPFLGYGEEHIYSSSQGQGIERAVVCQGEPADSVADDEVDDEAPEEVPAEDADAGEDAAGGEDARDDDTTDEAAAEDDDAQDDDADEEETTGPPVETDGPTTMAGANLGLIGGAALALAGAGIAGLALRRRDAQH